MYRLFIYFIFTFTAWGQTAPHGETAQCAWTYDEPEDWPTICGGIYKLCADGQHQSPISIQTADLKPAPLAWGPLQFSYIAPHHQAKMSNHGGSIHVTVDGHNTLTGGPLGSELYYLEQFHFHTPGEHLLNGDVLPFEVHFVHRTADESKTAVVAVWYVEGEESRWLDQVVAVRDAVNASDFFQASLEDIDLATLVPSTLSEYYSYKGSFTTPPCTEGVQWLIFYQPLTISDRQVRQLTSWEGLTNRPINPTRGHEVFISGVIPPPIDTDDSSMKPTYYVFGIMLLLAATAIVLGAIWVKYKTSLPHWQLSISQSDTKLIHSMYSGSNRQSQEAVRLHDSVVV